MKILFCGDVVGRAGRKALTRWMPQLREKHQLDAVIINGENSAGGFGITKETLKEMLDTGADVITGGDHIWDQRDCPKLLEQEPRLLRPHNYPEGSPGSGFRTFELKNGQRLTVMHLLGQIFHKEYLNSPFECAKALLDGVKLGRDTDAIVVDMHAEATSEKCAMGHFLDGQVSLVVGSHTHIPTADSHILPKGTAYQTDAGMCGDYNSVIGFEPSVPLKHYMTKRKLGRMEVASGEGTVCAVLVETDIRTGLATSIEPIRCGGVIGMDSASDQKAA